MQANTKGALAACAIIAAGCASSPTTFRVVPLITESPGTQLKAYEILAPGVRRIQKGNAYRYVIDVVLAMPPGRCPANEAGDEKFSARFLRAGIDTALLRVTISTRQTAAELRTAWDHWRMSDAGAQMAACLSEEDLKAIPDRVETARPVNGEESLEAVFGLGPLSPVVSLKPGMSVCASDAFMRNVSVDAYVPSGLLCTRVARSPLGGAVLDPIRYSLINITNNSTDGATSAVAKIASWAEVPREANALQYLVRYPSGLPKPAENIKPHEVSLLVSLQDKMEPDVRRAAIQCIADATKVKDFCQVAVKELPDKCGNPQVQLNVKPRCYRFGERGVMSVSMPVMINGAQADVDVGTLVGDAAARLGRASVEPPVIMMRWHQGHLHALEFKLKDKAQAFDLPLLPGDQLSW